MRVYSNPRRPLRLPRPLNPTVPKQDILTRTVNLVVPRNLRPRYPQLSGTLHRHQVRRIYSHSIRHSSNLSLMIVIDPRLTKNQTLLLLFARALMTHGAPLARTEVQLVELARILKVVVEVLRLPGGLICTFFDRSVELIPRRTARTHYLKVGGRLNMENLRRIHSIYMLVCKGFTNAEAATEELLNIGVRLRGGEWSTGLTRQIECFLVALQDILHHRPKPILAWRRNRWERKLTNTHRVEGTVT